METKEMIKETMSKIEKLTKPFIIFVSPNEKAESIDELSRYGEVFKNPAVGNNQVFIVKRSEVEEYLTRKENGDENDE